MTILSLHPFLTYRGYECNFCNRNASFRTCNIKLRTTKGTGLSGILS